MSGAPAETPSAETPSAGAPAAAKRAASSAGSSSFADIFSRPMEESSDEEEEVPAAALETDLEKYLKLPELPLTMADARWEACRHPLVVEAARPQPTGRPSDQPP